MVCCLISNLVRVLRFPNKREDTVWISVHEHFATIVDTVLEQAVAKIEPVAPMCVQSFHVGRHVGLGAQGISDLEVAQETLQHKPTRKVAIESRLISHATRTYTNNIHYNTTHTEWPQIKQSQNTNTHIQYKSNLYKHITYT